MSSLNLSSTSHVSHWCAAVLKAHFGDQREYANAKSSLGFFERHCVSIGKPFAGNMGQPVVDSYKLTLQNRQLAPETINKRLHHVSTLFKFMGEHNLTLAGKLKGVRMGYVNVPKNKRKWWLGDAEEQAMFDLLNKLATNSETLDERLMWALVGDYFEFVCEVGLRVEECLRLLPSDFRELGITGNEGLVVPGTKNDASEAYVPISTRAATIARQRIEDQHKRFGGVANKRLFDVSYKTLQRRFNDLRDWLGWPANATLKGLRRTFAGRSLRKGLDVRMVQELMRHSSEESTREYLKLFGLANNPETRAKLNQRLNQTAARPSVIPDSDSLGPDFADVLKQLFGEDRVVVMADWPSTQKDATHFEKPAEPEPVVHYWPGVDPLKVTCPGCLAVLKANGMLPDHG